MYTIAKIEYKIILSAMICDFLQSKEPRGAYRGNLVNRGNFENFDFFFWNSAKGQFAEVDAY